ncbi:MAG TPA: NACHT domain-containing protein [Solirubrobacterales bacterium]|nr:NACHT domain-containing protein [Solirubrobacterales bacterium]
MSTHKSDRTGKDFEDRVAETYEALDYEVLRNVQVAGRQTDLLVRKDIPGASKVVLAVECKDHSRAIGSPLVDAFSSRILAQSAAGEITGGVLVSRKGFTASAAAAADVQPNITLLSLKELVSQIFNVRHALRELVEGYEGEPIFHDYLPLKVETHEWSKAAKSLKVREFAPLMKEVVDFDDQRGIGVMLVLADFGAGKTTLLRHVAYERARAHLEGEDTRLPLFVQLRNFSDSQDLSTLLRDSFHATYMRDLPLGMLWHRIETGRFYLLLDGFDEMVDRSDSGRRLELFHTLLPLLRSRSPVILTSRPSYLVEPGELDALLAELHRDGERPRQAIKGGRHSKVVSEELRRKLSESLQEAGRNRHPPEYLDPNQVSVLRLRALDWPQVEEFVASHKSELEQHGYTVPGVLDFIKRTYDLTDLATRPMLLRLIVSTVVLGGIDIGDTSQHYGAAGLYEMYTRAKLQADIEKLPSARGGLDVDVRRSLAEALALEMFRTRSLEVDFNATLERLVEEDNELHSALAKSGLSSSEIATDIAARSFVTLERDSTCRFIHKSFRGFFVARVLKEALPSVRPMLEEPLEQEVLYFLGGFDATEDQTGKALWRAFRQAPNGSARRRNLLIAFLYTRPDHKDRTIKSSEISAADFGQLQFTRVDMTDVAWDDVSIRQLNLVKVKWNSLHWDDVRVSGLLLEGGKFNAKIEHSTFGSWVIEKGDISLALSGTAIDHLEVERGSFTCRAGGGVSIKKATVDSGTATLENAQRQPGLSVSELVASGGRIDILGAKVDTLEAKNSVVTYLGEPSIPQTGQLKGCILKLGKGFAPKQRPATARRVSAHLDRSSIILGNHGVPQVFLGARGGVFGKAISGEGERPLPANPKAWGVLEAEKVLEKLHVPRSVEGCRLNGVLLLRRTRYRDLVDRHLSSLAKIENLSPHPSTITEDIDRLKELSQELKTEYDALLEQGNWVELERYVTR